jgi:hypothetical protein
MSIFPNEIHTTLLSEIGKNKAKREPRDVLGTRVVAVFRAAKRIAVGDNNCPRCVRRRVRNIIAMYGDLNNRGRIKRHEHENTYWLQPSGALVSDDKVNALGECESVA